MKRLLVLVCVTLPASAWALDPVDANKPIDCTVNTEVFYPRGDSWAFLPGGSCKGSDASLNAPTGSVDPLPDTPGHCLWVSFDSQGPACRNGCPSDLNEHAERARKTVFAAMRTWSGMKAGDSGFGNPDWYCPTPTQNEAGKLGRVTSTDYSFTSPTSNTALPTLAFFRGPNISPTETLPGSSNPTPNKGDTQECWTECVPSLNGCLGLDELAPQQNPKLYKCPDTLTDYSKARFRFNKVRNNVVWVQGQGKWLAELRYSAGTLAVTETLFWPDNGVAITSDMLINNETIDWRFGNPDSPGGTRVGCDQGMNNCFDLDTVTLHESGHFIGMGHIDCQGAVMYKSALPSTALFDLSKHEMAGVCSLYRPKMGDGRFPSTSRENEGCYTDGDCTGGGMKCLFASRSFYKDATELQGQTDQAKKIPHRGICVKSAQCTGDSTCDPTHGRVCQAYDDAGTERYCLPGSPSRPPPAVATAQDLCAPCESSSECTTGICATTQDMGITLTVANPPKSLCSAKCSLVAGCEGQFSCKKVGTGAACVPNQPDQCVTAALQNVKALNEDCTDSGRCAAGLTCFDLLNGAKVCLEKCSTENKCATGYGCVFPLPDMNGMQSAEGGCFKKDMKEGDNCAIPETTTCGLKCQTVGSQEVCIPTDERICFFDPRLGADGPKYAQCYALCTMASPCKGAGQKCNPLKDSAGNAVPDATGQQPLGYCSPVQGGTCLRDVAEACDENAQCLSGDCRDFSGVKTCTKACDLANHSGCPVGADCGTDAQNKPVCKPTAGPRTGICSGTAKLSGCNCGASPTSAELAAVLLGAAWLLRRSRRPRA